MDRIYFSRTLLIILLVSTLLRLAGVVYFHNEPLRIIDEQQYNGIAQTLACTGNFATPEGELTSIRPPAFVAMTASVYRLVVPSQSLEAGEITESQVRTVLTIVRLIQTLLAVGTIILIWLISRLVYTVKTADLTAGLYAFYPTMFFQTFQILTETLFTFLLVLVLYLLTLILLHPQRRVTFILSLACGLAMGLGALTRSILWLAIPCTAVYVLLFVTASFRRRLAIAVLVFSAGVLVITPWAVRNTRLQSTVTIVDCMSGRNLMMGNYEYTPLYRAWDAISLQPPEDWVSVLRNYTHPFNSLTQGQKDKIAARYAKEFICDHPVLTAKRIGMKTLCFWQLERSIPSAWNRGYYGATPATAKLATVLLWLYYAIVFVAAVFGLFIAFPQCKTVGFLWVCVILLFWGVHALVFAHSRYHLPLVPLMCIFAVAGVSTLLGRWRGEIQLPKLKLLVPAAIVSVYGLFWALEIRWFIS